jgi:hypothetical protein
VPELRRLLALVPATINTLSRERPRSLCVGGKRGPPGDGAIEISSVGICVAHQGDSKVTAAKNFMSGRYSVRHPKPFTNAGIHASL